MAPDPHRMDAAEAVTDRLVFVDAQTQPPGAAPALIVTGPPQPDDGWCLREALLAVMCPPLLTRGSRVLRSTTASLAHRLAQACQARQLESPRVLWRLVYLEPAPVGAGVST